MHEMYKFSTRWRGILGMQITTYLNLKIEGAYMSLPLPNLYSLTGCPTPSALTIPRKPNPSSRGIIHTSRSPGSLSYPMRRRPNSSKRSGRSLFHWPNLKYVSNNKKPPSNPRPIPITISTFSTRRLKHREKWLSRFVSARRPVSPFQPITHHHDTVDGLVHSPPWRHVRIQ